jgi:hypothetical protein
MSQISVELKLQLDAAMKQARAAAKELGITFKSAGTTAMAAETDKAASSQEKLTKSVKTTNDQLKQQAALAKAAALASAQADVNRLRAAREAATVASRVQSWMGAEQGQKFTDPAEAAARSAAAAQLRIQRAARTIGGGGLATVPPNLNGGGLAYPAATVPAPQFKVAGAQAQTLAQRLGGLRAAVLPLGQVLASFYMIGRTINAMLAPFRMFARMLKEAYENGKRLYAQSVQSGMGIGMTQSRNSLASALGVSQNEIYQFGAAIAWIGDRFENSNRILAQTAPTLAAVSWAGAALEQSFKAVEAEIANEFAPVLVYLEDAIRLFVETISNSDMLPGIAKELADAFSVLAVTMKVVMVAVSGITLLFQGLADTLTWIMVKVNNLIALIPGAGKLGITPIINKDANFYHGSKAIVDGITKQFENNNPFKKVQAPAAQAYMKQMPASAWERMGLVIGAAGGTNYAKESSQTLKRVEATLLAIERLTAAGNKFNISQPAGLPGGA